MMKLNHINLYSHDVLADQAMFERYFGLQTLVVRGEKMVIMQDDAGLVLILNHFEKRLGGFVYPEDFDTLHIGFIQPSRDVVDDLYTRLCAEGWELQPPRNFHGAWAFYVKAKGGYFIEVATETLVKPQERSQSALS
ncbi:VOC family protein [Acetobacter persici]|uniref:VOC family protein n=1 Tax=Acetobacter persici TaxID=1076596 RepID=UPI001F417D94|nr:VOC family protein [Acetobacter persici]MCG0997170.1 VOC family protein [Acetobacter persici]